MFILFGKRKFKRPAKRNLAELFNAGLGQSISEAIDAEKSNYALAHGHQPETAGRPEEAGYVLLEEKFGKRNVVEGSVGYSTDKKVFVRRVGAYSAK